MGERDDRAKRIADAVWDVAKNLDTAPDVVLAGILFAAAFVAHRYGASHEIARTQFERCWQAIAAEGYGAAGPRLEVVSASEFDEMIGDLHIPNIAPLGKRGGRG